MFAEARVIRFWADDEKKARRFKAADVGFMIGSCWPRAGYEELRFAAHFLAWIFLWDDHFDDAKDVEVAQEYCVETRKYVERCLLADREGGGVEPHDDKILAAFKEVVSGPLCQNYEVDRRKVLLEQFIAYFDGVREETRVLLSSEVPSVRDYWRYRIYCSAAGPMLLVDDYVRNLGLPIELLRDERAGKLVVRASEHLFLVNDLLSVKKEVGSQTISLVALLFEEKGRSLQRAVDEIVEQIGRVMGEFEETARTLGEKYGKDVAEEFVAGLRFCCRGTLAWSLGSKRYGLEECGDRSGGLVIRL